MDIRCGSCEKLFRVSDDKITGTGIKFPCTRCGEYIRITREDFEHYTLSQSAVSVLDLFDPDAKQSALLLSSEAAEPVVEETVPPTQESKDVAQVPASTPEDALAKESPFSVEPDQAAPAAAEEIKPADALTPETVLPPEQKAEPPVEPHPEARPETVKPPTPVATPPAPQARPAMPKKETSHPSAPSVSRTTERLVKKPVLSSAPSRSGRMLLILIGGLIIAGLAAYGIFIYFQASSPGEKGNTRELFSIEGLHLVKSGGTLQENGDLLITGVIKNTTEKQKIGWYVVAEVYDAKGAVLSRIRLLRGKQIYSRRDYDILTRRGANIQELKAKILQEKGVVIPPKGTVRFEMRYLNPPATVAGFNPQLLPFDLVKLLREISTENK